MAASNRAVSQPKIVHLNEYPTHDPGLVAMSLQVARAFGLRFATVGYIIGPTVDAAHLFLRATLEDGHPETPTVSDSLIASPAGAYS